LLKAFKHFYLARNLESIDRIQAIREYNEAIKYCPDVATFYNNLGLNYYNLNQYSNAEINYLKSKIKEIFFFS
jgi:tetratricopeptide (TPR) repeat protein